MISHRDFCQKFNDVSEQPAASISYSEDGGCRLVQIVTIFFYGLYSKIFLWKIQASDILANLYPAACENQYIILYNILTVNMTDIILCNKEQ